MLEYLKLIATWGPFIAAHYDDIQAVLAAAEPLSRLIAAAKDAGLLKPAAAAAA